MFQEIFQRIHQMKLLKHCCSHGERTLNNISTTKLTYEQPVVVNGQLNKYDQQKMSLKAKGLSFANINLSRSIMSGIIALDEMQTVIYPLVYRSLQSVHNITPCLLKHNFIWDDRIERKCLSGLSNSLKKESPVKLTIVLTILCGERASDIYQLLT